MTTSLETVAARNIHTGSVVTLDGGRRRYAVTTMDVCGQLSLIAISGAFTGCAPSGVEPSRLTVVAVPRAFVGKRAGYLAQRYAVATHGQPDVHTVACARLAAIDLPKV